MNNNILGPRERQKLLSGRRDLIIPNLPEDWKVRTILKAPEYDCKRGSDLMNNVRWGKSNDENLLNVWDEIIEDVKREDTLRARRASRSLKRQKVAIPA